MGKRWKSGQAAGLLAMPPIRRMHYSVQLSVKRRRGSHSFVESGAGGSDPRWIDPGRHISLAGPTDRGIEHAIRADDRGGRSEKFIIAAVTDMTGDAGCHDVTPGRESHRLLHSQR